MDRILIKRRSLLVLPLAAWAGTDALAQAATAATASPATSLHVPAPLRIQYAITSQIRGISLPAQGELLWKHDGASYDARLNVGAFLLGTRVQESRGRITPAGLVPRRFSDSGRSEPIEFDEQPFQARPRAARAPVPLEAGTQDGASIFVQLAMRVGSAPDQYPPGTAFTVPVINRRRPEAWRFTMGGEETLRFGSRSMRAIKLTRPGIKADEPDTTLWLAPMLGWLPARIRLDNEKGDYIDQRWRSDESPS